MWRPGFKFFLPTGRGTSNGKCRQTAVNEHMLFSARCPLAWTKRRENDLKIASCALCEGRAFKSVRYELRWTNNFHPLHDRGNDWDDIK